MIACTNRTRPDRGRVHRVRRTRRTRIVEPAARVVGDASPQEAARNAAACGNVAKPGKSAPSGPQKPKINAGKSDASVSNSRKSLTEGLTGGDDRRSPFPESIRLFH